MDLKDLEKRAKSATDTPKDAIKYLVDCLWVYQQGDDKSLGYMGYVLAKSFCEEDPSSPSGFKPNKRYTSLIKSLKEHRKRNSVLSTMGATWQNDYKDIDVNKYEIKWGKETKDGDETRHFIIAGGRDNPFPVNVKQNNKGQWKIMGGLSTMCMDVRPTKSEKGDF